MLNSPKPPPVPPSQPIRAGDSQSARRSEQGSLEIHSGTNSAGQAAPNRISLGEISAIERRRMQAERKWWRRLWKTLNPQPTTVSSAHVGDANDDDILLEDAQLSWFQRVILRREEGIPAWMVSFVIHVLLLLILALAPLHQIIKQGLSLKASFGEPGADAAEFSLEPASDALFTEMAAEMAVSELTPQMPIEPVVPNIPELSNISLSVEPQAIRLGLSGRDGLMRSTLLSTYGGTAQTEEAVALGLKWLAAQQQRDGSWSLKKPYGNGGVNENVPAATAMALLAFLGAGNTHQGGEYHEVVARGLKALLRDQDEVGFMAADAPDRQEAYAQAQGTIALCELYGMSHDSSLYGPAQLAIQFAEKAQHELGGWRYHPREDSDLSVTGWYVMALVSGKMAGLEVDPEVLDNVQGFLNSVQSSEGAMYGYTGYENPSATMTAEGLLCREYLGWSRTDPRLRAGVEIVLSQKMGAGQSEPDYYRWYYATQVLHHYGGEPWKEWNAAMREQLPARQVRNGKEAGSWDPRNDPWGSAGGRMYSTCLSIYCLEVYYRHLPLYGFAEGN